MEKKTKEKLEEEANRDFYPQQKKDEEKEELREDLRKADYTILVAPAILAFIQLAFHSLRN